MFCAFGLKRMRGIDFPSVDIFHVLQHFPVATRVSTSSTVNLLGDGNLSCAVMQLAFAAD